MIRQVLECASPLALFPRALPMSVAITFAETSQKNLRVMTRVLPPANVHKPSGLTNAKSEGQCLSTDLTSGLRLADLFEEFLGDQAEFVSCGGIALVGEQDDSGMALRTDNEIGGKSKRCAIA